MIRELEFYRHGMGADERAAVLVALQDTILTTGKTVAELEAGLCRLLGTPEAVALDSCTGALHLALAALGIGPGDEVITTPLSFVASAASIAMAGGRPVFVDVEPRTGNIDPILVERAITPRTRAVLPVHLYGLMCDMRALSAIAEAHGLPVVEDAAHCLEGERDGVTPGSIGSAACFSFYATKSITCGEGGALVTNDTELTRRVRLLSLHGMTETAEARHREGYRHWDVVELGWKYNLDNIRAAMLIPQLAKVHVWRQRRADIAARYHEEFSAAGIEHPWAAPADLPGHAHHLFTIWTHAAYRDRAMVELRRRGIPTTVNYRPIHLLSHFHRTYGYGPGAFPVAESIGERTITLPLYPSLQDEEVQRIIDAVLEVCGNV